MLVHQLWKFTILLAVVNVCLIIAGMAQTQSINMLKQTDVFHAAIYASTAAFGLMLLLTFWSMYKKIPFSNHLITILILLFLVPWILGMFLSP